MSIHRLGSGVLAVVVTVLLLVQGTITAAADNQPIEVTEIRTNETHNPLGIEDTKPALSWKLDAGQKGSTQSAYEIRVATTLEGLETGEDLVWETGKVSSSQSIQVPYEGEDLRSFTRYYWQVRVWDEEDNHSSWSSPGWWEMALLSNEDWQGAQWITPEAEAMTYEDFEIESDFRLWGTAGGVVFRAEDHGNMNMWQVSKEWEPPRLRQHIWRNGSVVANKEVDLPPEVMDIDEPDGTSHTLRIRAEGNTYTTWIDDVLIDEWTVDADELNPSGVIGFRGGDPQPNEPESHSSAWSNVTVSSLDGEVLWEDDFEGDASAYFPSAIIENGELMRKKNEVILASAPTPDSPLLRTEFELNAPVESARAYVYGLGFYEMLVNGQKAGDRVLAPSATPFDHRNLYQTYDITDLVTEGDNAVGLWLAEGYGQSYSEWGWQWTGPRQAIALLRVTHPDGSVSTITTNEDTWKTNDSPITEVTLYGGETYDARLEHEGWAEPNFDDTNWAPSIQAEAPSDQFQADEMPPIRVGTSFEPASVTEVEPGVFVYDFGQNMAGWTMLRDVDLPEGTEVKIRHAERIDDDGKLDTHTNRSAAATDYYISRGEGPVNWEPRFTYHGFRYAEITGVEEPLDAVGRSIHADLEFASTFESSEPLLDQIFINNRWTLLNNFMSFPTDTPVRDERTPPQMDVQAHQDASIRTFNMSSYFRKYLDDIPGSRQGTTYAGDTTMFGIHIPLALALYEEYGDLQVLEEQWIHIEKRADWLLDNHPTGVWPTTDGAHGDEGRFGDWCPPLPEPEANGGLGDWNVGACFSEPNLVTSALHYRHISQAAKIAEILGHTDQAEHYTHAAEEIREAVNTEYLNADGSYASGRQVTSILPIVFGLVPEDRLEDVTNYFVHRVEEVDGGHLDTGIFGTRFLIDALIQAGRPDLALGTMTKTTYPSFGYQILEHDATTAWEGWTLRSGMHTYDHAMFVGPNASFMSLFGGIQPTLPGYEEILIAPVVPDGLDHVEARQQTVRGEVVSQWEQTPDSFELLVEIPTNSRAEVLVPVAEGREVNTPQGAELLGISDGVATFMVGSGSYHFVASKESQQPDPDPSPEPSPDPSDPAPEPTGGSETPGSETEAPTDQEGSETSGESEDSGARDSDTEDTSTLPDQDEDNDMADTGVAPVAIIATSVVLLGIGLLILMVRRRMDTTV